MSRDPVVIGVDVGGTLTRAGIVDREGDVLVRTERPTDVQAGTKGVLAAIEDLLSRVDEVGVDVVSVGVGAAGFIDAARGAVTFSPNLVYDDPLVRDAIKARVEVPVVVDNDANVAVWGERAYGTARGAEHVAMITIGTGIGSGFVVEGRLVRGFTGAGAEFGHTIVDPNGPECNCGLRGCLEQLASGQAITRMGREAAEQDPQTAIITFAGSKEGITTQAVARAAREYDETARTVLRRAGRYLGIGLSNIANIFDPEVIVLAGGVTSAGEAYLGAARDQLATMTEAQKRRPMRLDVTSLGRDMGIIGAAALAMHEGT